MTQRSIWTLPIPLRTRTSEGCRDDQFSSRWYLRARKSPYALHPVPQVFFSQLRLWNGSKVRLIDDGPLSSFQGRSSSAYSFHVRLSGLEVTRSTALLAAVSLGWRKKTPAVMLGVFFAVRWRLKGKGAGWVQVPGCSVVLDWEDEDFVWLTPGGCGLLAVSTRSLGFGSTRLDSLVCTWRWSSWPSFYVQPPVVGNSA